MKEFVLQRVGLGPLHQETEKNLSFHSHSMSVKGLSGNLTFVLYHWLLPETCASLPLLCFLCKSHLHLLLFSTRMWEIFKMNKGIKCNGLYTPLTPALHSISTFHLECHSHPRNSLSEKYSQSLSIILRHLFIFIRRFFFLFQRLVCVCLQWSCHLKENTPVTIKSLDCFCPQDLSGIKWVSSGVEWWPSPSPLHVGVVQMTFLGDDGTEFKWESRREGYHH